MPLYEPYGVIITIKQNNTHKTSESISSHSKYSVNVGDITVVLILVIGKIVLDYICL